MRHCIQKVLSHGVCCRPIRNWICLCVHLKCDLGRLVPRPVHQGPQIYTGCRQLSCVDTPQVVRTRNRLQIIQLCLHEGRKPHPASPPPKSCRDPDLFLPFGTYRETSAFRSVVALWSQTSHAPTYDHRRQPSSNPLVPSGAFGGRPRLRDHDAGSPRSHLALGAWIRLPSRQT